MKNKTYKNFGDAFLELKECFPTISYGKIARELDITDSYAWNLPNRRRKAPIPKRMLIELAKIFKVKPSYFYEYRLQELLEFIDNERRFLDYCLRQSKKFKKVETEFGRPIEEIEEELEKKEEFEDLKETEEERIKKSADIE
jgi:transcriptional regulator with XRE-family HTH domain